MAASSLLLTFNSTTVLSRFSGGGGTLRCSSTRRFCQPMSARCSLKKFESHSIDLFRCISPNVVTTGSSFSAPDGSSSIDRLGNGVFLDPTLILTSASLVGHVAAEKPDGSVLHGCHFGETTLAVTCDNRVLKMKPLAVNFRSDVAVLKVVVQVPPTPLPEKITFPRYSMADSLPSKDDLLIGITHMGDTKFAGGMPGSIRSNVGEKRFKVKAPWPLDNDLGWLEFDMSIFNGGHPAPSSSLFTSKDEITGSLAGRLSGSPLFSTRAGGELVGVFSWEVREKADSRFPVIFAASILSIRNVVDYAKNKKPEDPIVMDTWIEGSYHKL